jgi:accessory gene regulator protein AgrB
MTENRPLPFSPEDMARRKKRAIIMALGLAALMAIFYITTIVRLGANVAERTL